MKSATLLLMKSATIDKSMMLPINDLMLFIEISYYLLKPGITNRSSDSTYLKVWFGIPHIRNTK